MPLSEFQLIQHYFQAHAAGRDDVVLGIGDDAALVTPHPDCELVLAIDTLVAGVHFPLDTDAADIGYKLLAVNLSDLAAMGAEPSWMTLALTLPESDSQWLEKFSQGLFELADQYGVAIIGGDTTRGPLTLSLQAHGQLPGGSALQRSGARPGDSVFVTGVLGGAAIALAALQGEFELSPDEMDHCRARLDRPTPRLAVGQALRGIATAAIDISDGLMADLGHIAGQSGVGAEIVADQLPLDVIESASLSAERHRQLALTVGDDYELCFTAPDSAIEKIRAIAFSSDCSITEIGKITASESVRVVDWQGKPIELQLDGYQHFPEQK